MVTRFQFSYWDASIERYGLTKIEVRRMRGVSFHEFHNQSDNDSQDIILSKTICGFSDFIDATRPDLVIVHGDRVEAMACAIVLRNTLYPMRTYRGWRDIWHN